MRIAVCGDDERELARLCGLIAEYQSSRGLDHDCCSFRNGTDFLCDMKEGKYELVLLDGSASGKEVAKELREMDKCVKIILISALPESAETCYQLLRPADADSLFALLDRLSAELALQEEQGLLVKSRKGIARIFFKRLEYVEVMNKTVVFHLADGAVCEVTAALGDFEEQLLVRPEFVKTHRSFLVNLRYIREIDAGGVLTRSGHKIPVSRQRNNQVREAYMSFLHQPEAGGQGGSAAERPGRAAAPWRILLVEDDAAERTLWADILRRHGCVVRLAENGKDAVKLASDEFFDCVLLDVMLPGEDGFAVCERLRKQTGIPIIFLSSLTDSDRQVKGFAVGGIDYITKDTSAELFWAKVEARIRLSAAAERTQLCYGPLLLDLTGHRALLDGEELALTPVEFDILRRLSERADHVFTPEEIFDMIWGGQLWDGGQLVRTHMSRLRRKLEKAWEGHCFIETVWGQGYRFVPAEH